MSYKPELLSINKAIIKDVKKLYREIFKNNWKKIYFPNGIPSEKDWMKGKWVYSFTYNNVPIGAAWIDDFDFASAKIHVCPFPTIYKRYYSTISKIFLKNLLIRCRHTLCVLIGLVPKENRMMRKFAERIGFVERGEIPQYLGDQPVAIYTFTQGE